MESAFPLLFAAVVGFGHAFEADHLVAVSSIVTRRDRTLMAIKDGIFWGLGHTSTILIIGLIIIIGKASISGDVFSYLEAGVGLMLIILGVYRLYQFFVSEKRIHTHDEGEPHHHLAYGVGLVHGLAGSGAMILLVMSEIRTSFNSIIYLLIFGIGSVVGMLVAAGVFSLPFSKRFTQHYGLQMLLIIISSLLCIGYGGYVVLEHLN